MKSGRANRCGDGSGLEHRVTRKSFGSSTLPPSVKLWSDKELQAAVEVASSATDALRKLGLKKTKRRLDFLRDEIVRLKLDTSSFCGPGSRKVFDNELIEAVAVSRTYSDVLRTLGIRLAGGTIHHYKKRIERLGADTSHFLKRGWSRDKVFSNRRKDVELVLARRKPGSYKENTYILRRTMLEVGFIERCSLCGMGATWERKKLVLEIDHIDGDPMNNLKENLRFLCPNCHSQTKTYKNKNRR